MSHADQERIRKYELELARLDELHQHLEQLWTHVPRYALLGLAAPFVWYFASFGWAVTTLLVTGALVGTQAYLIGVRKNENRFNRSLIERDLAGLRDDLAKRE
jgi:hypothetical protein